MANTPNLNLALPAHGSANWDAPLNSNFSLIDAGVVLNAPTADQVIAGGHDLNSGSLSATTGTQTVKVRGTQIGATDSVTGGLGFILFNADGSFSLNPKPGTNVTFNNGSAIFVVQMAQTDGTGILLYSSNVPVHSVNLVPTATTLANQTVRLPDNSGTLLVEVAAPATAASAGVAGQMARDANFIYSCVATNQWKRVAIATW